MKVGRFQVMAILQAARANELGFSDSHAKSRGLNRAIFYAAAKRGFKHHADAPGRGGVVRKLRARAGTEYHLGDEMAYAARKGGRIYFTIGGQLQAEADFKRQIESRFGKHFPAA